MPVTMHCQEMVPFAILFARKEKPMDPPDRIQLHLELPYHQQPRDHPRIGALLDKGFVIADYQRVTDKEVSVTLVRAPLESS